MKDRQDSTHLGPIQLWGLPVGMFLAGILASLTWQNYLLAGTLMVLAVTFTMLNLFVPELILPIHKVVNSVISFITTCLTKIILTIAFLAVIIPYAVILRLLGKRGFSTAPDSSKTTYWRKVRRDRDAKSYYKQY